MSNLMIYSVSGFQELSAGHWGHYDGWEEGEAIVLYHLCLFQNLMALPKRKL
jgi:hypothetical protein